VTRNDVGLLERGIRTLRLVRVLAPRELRVRYRQSVLSVSWVLLAPVVILAVYGIILTQSFGVRSTCAPYLVTAWTGLVIWTFFATAVGGAVTSLLQSADLISKLYFPREALPLASVGAASVELVVGMVTVVGLAVVQGVAPGRWAPFALVPLVMLTIWTCAISIVVGVLAAFTRDIVHGVMLALRVGFFATAVMYEVQQLPGPFAWTARLNPVSVAITEVRNTLLCNTAPSWRLLSAHLVVASIALVAAVAYVRSVESRIVDVV
jgi:lipopolysaccharide transport system permease protein